LARDLFALSAHREGDESETVQLELKPKLKNLQVWQTEDLEQASRIRIDLLHVSLGALECWRTEDYFAQDFFLLLVQPLLQRFDEFLREHGPLILASVLRRPFHLLPLLLDGVDDRVELAKRTLAEDEVWLCKGMNELDLRILLW